MNSIQIQKPKVVIWFKIYAMCLGLIYLICFLISPFLILSGDDELLIGGIILLIASVPCLLASIIPIFLPRRPWVWIWSLVLIGFGMTSTCCLPASIVILIFWIKPEVKRYYGYQGI
tara:strand:- start:547 stop:897 length:351 start_codon:yes stop_codon:yes gene_type:complete